MSRLLAAELGKDKIRVNVVNPDAVIEGSKIWEGKWAEGRAKAYGVTVEELPAFYAKRTLLNEIISTEDIANGVLSFTGGHLSKSTGIEHILRPSAGKGAPCWGYPRQCLLQIFYQIVGVLNTDRHPKQRITYACLPALFRR